MGHFYETITGIGKNKESAQQGAIDDFLWEHGHRHSVRGIDKAVMLRKVAPKKEHREVVRGVTHVRQVEDPAAPPDQWLEEWEFELHTHA